MGFSEQITANLATNDLGRTAWGVPKVNLDYSLFHGMFTFNIPKRIWLQYNDLGAGFIEQSNIDNTLVKSTNGELVVSSDATTDIRLSSRRHLRYQPNRGLLYSTAVVLPLPNTIGKRRFGLKTNGSNGIMFELVGDGSTWALNLVKTTVLNGVISEVVTDITANLPAGFDPSKGHTYDIQMEWRGYGDFYFFVDLKDTHKMAMLGTLSHVSISNPALSVTFESTDFLAAAPEILVGCVDITSEGGSKENKQPSAISTGSTLLTTNSTGVCILAIRLPSTISYNGSQEPYTRDIVLKSLSTFCKDESFRNIYVARAIEVPNLDGLTWNVALDSYYEVINNSAGLLNTAFQLDKANMGNIYSVRGEKDIALEHSFEAEGSSPRYMTGGEILVIELKSDGNSTGGCTLKFGEEV